MQADVDREGEGVTGPGKFEWHITLDKQYRSQAMRVAESFGFTFSEITGCPILGKGTYVYITGFDTDIDVAKMEVDNCMVALAKEGIIVLRAKIEDIIYDTKTGVDKIAERR